MAVVLKMLILVVAVLNESASLQCYDCQSTDSSDDTFCREPFDAAGEASSKVNCSTYSDRPPERCATATLASSGKPRFYTL